MYRIDKHLFKLTRNICLSLHKQSRNWVNHYVGRFRISPKSVKKRKIRLEIYLRYAWIDYDSWSPFSAKPRFLDNVYKIVYELHKKLKRFSCDIMYDPDGPTEGQIRGHEIHGRISIFILYRRPESRTLSSGYRRHKTHPAVWQMKHCDFMKKHHTLKNCHPNNCIITTDNTGCVIYHTEGRHI